MNLAKRALGVPGYLYNYVAGSKDPNAEPLLEQARVLSHVKAV